MKRSVFHIILTWTFLSATAQQRSGVQDIEQHNMLCDASDLFTLDEEVKGQSIKMIGISPNIDLSFNFYNLDLQGIKMNGSADLYNGISKNLQEIKINMRTKSTGQMQLPMDADIN